MKISPEIKAILDRELPAKALKPHPTKTYLTTINPIYVVERLNEAFGVGGWSYESEVVGDVPKTKTTRKGEITVREVAVKCILKVTEFDIHIEQFGGNDNEDYGDAYKGAATDALTKIGSYLGIGAHVWRGEGVPDKAVTSSFDDKHMAAEEVKSKAVLDDALGTCGKCGANNKLSQRGKVYCEKKCWL